MEQVKEVTGNFQKPYGNYPQRNYSYNRIPETKIVKEESTAIGMIVGIALSIITFGLYGFIKTFFKKKKDDDYEYKRKKVRPKKKRKPEPEDDDDEEVYDEEEN